MNPFTGSFIFMIKFKLLGMSIRPFTTWSVFDSPGFSPHSLTSHYSFPLDQSASSAPSTRNSLSSMPYLSLTLWPTVRDRFDNMTYINVYSEFYNTILITHSVPSTIFCSILFNFLKFSPDFLCIGHLFHEPLSPISVWKTFSWHILIFWPTFGPPAHFLFASKSQFKHHLLL